ncbi:hypothetical protein Tco_0363382 [Tanacetum coccineum]
MDELHQQDRGVAVGVLWKEEVVIKNYNLPSCGLALCCLKRLYCDRKATLSDEKGPQKLVIASSSDTPAQGSSNCDRSY